MATVAELEALDADKIIDARGTACPGPMLEAKRAIGECPVGSVMEVQSSDSGTWSVVVSQDPDEARSGSGSMTITRPPR